jgi:PAS domain S-box-containing protein
MNSLQAKSASSGIRVLLIENGCGRLGDIKQLLSQTDFGQFSVDCVSNIADAATYLSGNGHDVCIISSQPDEGCNLLDLAKRVDSVIPCIVLTSDSTSEVIDAFHAGASDCLSRNELTASRLEQAICRVLQQTHLISSRLENQQRYFALVENAKDIIYTHDLQGNYLSANNAAEALTGYSHEEILNLNANQVVPFEFLDLSREMVQRKLDAQTETSYELEFITKDGRRIPVEVNSHLIYRSGKPVAVQGIARDISQRRCFESQLRASEERYRDLFENANDIVYVHDLSGTVMELNKAGELITGYSRDEAIGRNIVGIIAPEYREIALSMMSSKARGEVATVYELDIITKDSRRMALEISTRVILRDGKPVGVQGIGRDVTERKRSELERRVILEIIQSVTLTSNLDDLLHQVHQALAKILYAENCFVALYDDNWVHYSFWRDKFDEIPAPGPIVRGFSNHLVKTGEPLLLTEEIKQLMYERGEVEQEGTDCASWLGVPLKTPTQTIGVLVVQHYEDPNAYTQRDLEFLSSVGGQIALAIERKRAEEALKKSEAEYRDIFNNSPVGVYRSTLDGRLITANPALARILGYSSVAELLARNLVSDVYFDASERDELIARCLSRRLAEGLEVRWKKKDGTAIWVQLSAMASSDEAGGLAFFDGFIHDITLRKEAEAALRESEERYEQLVELSPDGIIVHSDGVISYINSAGVRLVGASSPESVVGQSIFNYIDETQHERFSDRVAQLQRGQFLPPAEMRARRVDASLVECEVMSVPFNANDKPGVQVVVRDITERKQAELAIDEANRRALADYERLVERIASLGQNLSNARDLQAILRAIRDFTMVSVPCDGMVISLYDPKESVRHPVYCWVDGAELSTNNMAFPVGSGLTGRALKTGTIFISNNYQQMLDEKTSIDVGDVSEGRVPNSALSAPMVIMGRIIGCIEIQSYDFDAYTEEHKTAMRLAASLAANAVENVSLIEREQEKEEQFRQSQKMEAIGKLAGGVAHDFNNLLTAISGYSDLGLRKLNEADPLRKNLEEIKKASTRASSLTRQLLAFSRKQMLQAKVIDVNWIVADMDRMLRRLIGEDIDLVTILDPNSCQVKADPGQIEQVILNLAVNARDAMPRGGKITIETQRVFLDDVYTRAHVAVTSGYYMMLAVSDTGDGMEPEIQKRVFEPFFTTKEIGKGTGLGLSTVYGIVKQSGGNVWVYSEIGRGSTFKVYLPLVTDSVETAEPKSQEPDVEQGNKTILLVEDEEMVRNLSLKILEMSGYRVLTAADGPEACKVCKDFSDEIHLMITDVVMPQMSGREVAEHAALHRPNMLVLFMSGYTDDAIVRHGVLDDGVPFLQKPFTPDALVNKVRQVLENQTVKC